MTDSIKGRLRHLVSAIGVLLGVLTAAALLMLVSYNRHYARLLHNVTTASEFNREFKNSIDQKMYYYVIESQYSQGLPIEEVRSAQTLAKSLQETTTQKDSRQAIASVLDLCENLERKIYQIEKTTDYDQRQSQLENNVYILTSLVEEYMYTYLYYEASELNAVQQAATRQMSGEIALIILAAALAMGFTLRYSIRLSHSITRPLEALSGRMEAVTGGDLTARMPVQSEIREIRTLSAGLEQMIARLDEQMQESRQRQESLRRTELALLQAQINPHFLYNTMDTIIWLIEADKQQEAVEMISNLSCFFRHSLSKGQDVITLSEEERHVQSYLQIQQARYQDIMTYTLEIDPLLADAMIPKLTLQPLVENALYHGIKLKRAKGTIRILGTRQGDDVILRVEDNGVGMSEARLEELRRGMQSKKPVGFGLSAVNQRLQLQFGVQYGLTMESREGVGTRVTARIPYVRKEALGI